MPKTTVIMNTQKLDKLLQNLKGQPARILHDGVEYGIFQEFGWTTGAGRHVGAKPFMTPALEHIRPAFQKGWKQVIENQALSAEDFVEKLARDAEGVAKTLAPYRTGNLKNSIAVHTPEEFRRFVK